ncbi:DUF4136 domain-containing protein [Motiliproteus sediminis]|uniref:DUF4136 domain-containing protein n=1 Tax=Motiliproteus sediminis TaxID=1468178 RepID=UPI001AEF8CA5|nr:DUF4136 domain-containing protein [Motiliproteus sediminis]
MTRLFTLILILLLAGCARIPVAVAVDYQPGTDFTQLTRYYWLPPTKSAQPASVYNSELVEQRVEMAVENELVAHGLFPTDQRDQAQLLISYLIVVEDRVDIDPVFAIEGSYSKHRGGMGVGLMRTHSTDYQQSRLIIDLRDPSEEQLLWRGSSERRLPGFDTPAEHAAFIAETVAAILAKYPPQP